MDGSSWGGDNEEGKGAATVVACAWSWTWQQEEEGEHEESQCGLLLRHGDGPAPNACGAASNRSGGCASPVTTSQARRCTRIWSHWSSPDSGAHPQAPPPRDVSRAWPCPTRCGCRRRSPRSLGSTSSPPADPAPSLPSDRWSTTTLPSPAARPCDASDGRTLWSLGSRTASRRLRSPCSDSASSSLWPAALWGLVPHCPGNNLVLVFLGPCHYAHVFRNCSKATNSLHCAARVCKIQSVTELDSVDTFGSSNWFF